MKLRIPDQLLLPWSPRVTISVERAAEILDVSRDTIERMCQDGTLMSYKVRPGVARSPWRINYDAFVKYCEDLHEKSGLEKRF
ncbi:excisionase family DNA-binding protein [Alloacidobacterium dinghuense]|uniref:Excisionase family DNA-binding protein n=1 Tax=Alloacidobacterium dinghuense TaxID=2763107 RepID=A0A7G8BPM1_9BACT|nr:excisionase family DNA-binding protein [Alloacidobacterium dinghuense]QNI34491.1 excisionase family DNA-binding protein [Alloacidobacterium dinghuense]